MDPTLDNKIAEEPPASLEEQLSNFARESEINPSSSQTGMEGPHAVRATIHRLRDWRYPASIGLVLLAPILGVVWWWSSGGTTVVPSSNATPLTQVLPKDGAPTAVAHSPDVVQQLHSIARDLAALTRAVEQLQLRQQQLVRHNESAATQLGASQAEIARNNTAIDQIKAVQIQMAQESKTVTEQLSVTQEQLARLVANTSAPKLPPEEKKQTSDQSNVTSEIPLPRPRRSTNVTQMHKPASAPARPQANTPQPPTWPWSTR